MRVRSLPAVFVARGSAPLPPEHRRRPRAAASLMALGVFVSITAASGFAAVAFGTWAIIAAVDGPRDEVGPLLVRALASAVVPIVAPRIRLWLLRRWMRREYGTAD